MDVSSPLSVSIVGCGWAGLPLGRALAQAGHTVRGSTTRSERTDVLKQAGIEPFVTRLTPGPTPSVADLFASDVLVCTVPPGRSNATDDVSKEVYQAQVSALIDTAQAHNVPYVVYLSSTGVYPPTNGPVTEDAFDPRTPEAYPPPKRPTAQSVRAAEHIVHAAYPTASLLVRLGGLFGPGRHPGRFIAGRTDVARPHAPVNMVHQADVVGAVQHLITRQATGPVNVVAPDHPTRQAFYIAAAASYDGAPPTFAEPEGGAGKRVMSTKLTTTHEYTFTYPDPIEALDALAA